MDYKEQTKKAMEMFAKDERTIFLGQTVCYPGSPMHMSFEDVPAEKKLELPVAEDMQMGMSIGLCLEGFIPISIYPRIDFLILAMNQLINHLDKVARIFEDFFNPKYKKALESDRSTILIEIPTGGTKAQIEKYGKLK